MLENPYDAVSDGLKQTVFTPASTIVDEHEKSLHTYLLLNAAVSPDIAICLEGFSPAYRSLFDVSVLDNLGHVAPYLVQVNAHSDVLDWWLADGYMRQWGIIVRSTLPLIPLVRHFKKFTKVINNGKTYFFRFYQPKTFNQFIPQLTPEQLADFFTPLYAVYTEITDEPGQLMHYAHDANGLKVTHLTLPVIPPQEENTDHVAL
ncbi:MULTISPECIES: DUF4123 domain-containing protein [unclassified Brenneria]|uniref:DUF4123 domain-containing protein n=1 Tax=unclassified Brenneria TaxID=2634434 RepID=UPI001557BE5E|nr:MULTISPECIES: DUF4123 domain-containing protein [unclassified Brenneria]MBJ7221497.1 DUF4123 domain-containing protein [Brenneria sp. L3-3C-1]MEE3642739.1 DUF4123 domain-containing protein [Brenneria sp. L3_3C_1]MEE3652664.1 DUF4123 domain-containing protein [Brenneria sp. HEZEL_4_2_4]NPD02622.1 DUF4123 domain-containing protein [Brenneria sp. hezel4-2-4]